MNPALLADLVVSFHFLYVVFAVGGEATILLGALFKWNWIRNLTFRIIHLAAVLFVAAESLLCILCPLTKLEHSLRTAAGQRVEEDITFVGQLIRAVIFYDFPPWFFTLIYVGFGLLVLASLLLIPPRRRGR